MRILKEQSTPSSQLERWLGVAQVSHISEAMRGWYGPPIALGGVPGNVRVGRDADFIGRIDGGGEASWIEYLADYAARVKRAIRRSTAQRGITLYAGFASLSDLISEVTANGKLYRFPFQKGGATGVIAATSSLWRVGNSPAGGAAGSAAPGGRALTDATPGAFPFTNPTGGDTLHWLSGFPVSSVAGNTLLLYDRLFDVAKTINSVATEAVTGVPTRYQSGTGTAADYIGGNFLFVEVGGTALAATAHNWTVCLYTDQASVSSTLPSLVGNSGTIVDRLDHPLSQWFAPLEAGDVGIKTLTQMQCSALVATGAVNFVIGHPIAWMPCPVVNMVMPSDGIRTAFQMTRIFDDAALAMLEVSKPAATIATYTGEFLAGAG